jgi:hypothetical protein
MSDAWASSWGTSWGSSWAAGVATVSTTTLKIMSLKLNQQLSISISYSGDCLPLSLATNLPTAAPASGKGLVAYIDGATLKLAAWTGSAWITT